MKMVWIVLRIFIGVLFAYAGFSKLIEPMENFAAILRHYEVIPDNIVIPIAYILPWVEWICGSFLILGYAPRINVMILSGVTFIFLMVLLASFLTDSVKALDCGCFGGSAIHLSPKQALIMDVVNLAILVRFIFMEDFAFSLDAFLKRSQNTEGRSQDSK